ncbi:Fc.00g048300.m01.CDS01 [Cosmosporella sp. VM-42]
MRLLIPHKSFLEEQKRSYGIGTYDKIYGELCINSVAFSYEATRLCLAFQPRTKKEIDAIRHILTTAGRYTVLLEEHESMTPTIISAIENREVKKPWDRLTIAANCCQYSIRLDVQKLHQQHHSLSLSILTMCLLNGEILYNG